MAPLVEFPLADGESVLIEVDPQGAHGGPVTRGLGGEQVTERAQRTFEDAVQRVAPAAQVIVRQLRTMAQNPDEIQVEFGLDLHAEAGAFVATASATANFRIALTWRSAATDGST